MINVYDLKAQYPDIWIYTGEETIAFVDMLELQGLISTEDVTEWKEKVLLSKWPEVNEWRARYWDVSVLYADDLEFADALVAGNLMTIEERDALGAAVYARQKPPGWKPEVDIEKALFEHEKQWYKAQQEGAAERLETRLKEDLPLLWKELTAPVKETLAEIWDVIEPQLKGFGDKIFEDTLTNLLEGGAVTPEDAPGLAGKMFGVALGAGLTAHAASVASEMIYPTKALGLNQVVGMIAQLGAFGPVAAATLGQVHYAALRVPMSYHVNSITRSRLPDEQLLQILAVKPDIPMELFIETMKYHGYSDFWIDRIKATMYHEPRYFELKMMSEDEAATDEWLWEKSRRAGFSEADTKIMVSSYIKGATRDQRKEYYKQGFNLFKEGYIQREHFNKILADLELRPEAVTWAVKGAELAYLLDTISDEVKYWTDSYLKDLVTDDELELQLSLLGMNRWRVDLAVRRAKVRKYKKPGKPVPTELEKAMNQIRSKYSQGYVTLYRKDLIDIDTLYLYLLEIGIVEELAEATCFLEEARKAEALPG